MMPLTPTQQFLAGFVMVLFGLIVSVIVGISLRAIFGRTQSAESPAAERTTYQHRSWCYNCHRTLYYRLPLGVGHQNAPQDLRVQVCPGCGCRCELDKYWQGTSAVL